MRALLVAVVFIGGCGGPPEGPPIELVVNNRFGDEFDYGVLEIREGGCESETAPLLHRVFFPAAAMEGLDPGTLTFERGEELCIRVFAVLDEATIPPADCTLIAADEQSVIVGETPGVVIDVLRLRTEPEGDGGALPSQRDAVNGRYAAGICQPGLVSPFDGEHLGSARPAICDRGRCALRPRLRFRHVPEAQTYCIEMRPAREGASANQVAVPASEVGTGPFAQWAWDSPAFAETDAAYHWRVRACSSESCPGDASSTFADGAERCTRWSEVRELVTRPRGDLNGDDRSDFALGAPSGDVHVFLSTDPGVAGDTYEICGQTFSHQIVGTPERDYCRVHIHLMGLNGAYGAAVLVADVGGDDERAELIVSAPNCVEDVPVAAGGGLFIYGGEDFGLLATHWFDEVLEGDLPGASSYGLHLQQYRRSSSDTRLLIALGASLSPIVEFRMAPVSLQPSLRIDRGTIFPGGAYQPGIGDLNADGRQDLLDRAATRYLPRSGDTFVVQPTGLASSQMAIAGDLDDDDRAEILDLGLTDALLCDQDVALRSIEDDGRLVTSTSWNRLLPFIATADCRPATPPGTVNERCDTAERTDRPCDITEEMCPVCFITGLSEATFASVAPRGTAWSGGQPIVALMERDFLRFYDQRETTSFAFVPRPPGASLCTGRIMRSAFDFDGDGYDDFLVLDPAAPAGTSNLHVICGSGDAPVFEAVENDDGPFSTPGGTCNTFWSLSN